MVTKRENRSSTGPIRRALLASLRAATVDPRDGATIALAKRLAALLDEAAPRSAYVEHLLRLERAVARYDGDDLADVERSLRRVVDALGQHSVASDLGPKYLATLAALGLTPAGRGAKGGAQGGGTGSSKLDELRARRQRGAG